MNDQARPNSSDLLPVDERELTRLVQMKVESIGRRSVHLGDKIMAAYVATMVVRAIPGDGPRHPPGAADELQSWTPR
jgi:hypothetical protein